MDAKQPFELPLELNTLNARVIHLTHDGASVAFTDNLSAAAYIVRAVNAHAELVAALVVMLPDYEHLAFPENDSWVCQERQAIVSQARAALSKVKGCDADEKK